MPLECVRNLRLGGAVTADGAPTSRWINGDRHIFMFYTELKHSLKHKAYHTHTDTQRHAMLFVLMELPFVMRDLMNSMSCINLS